MTNPTAHPAIANHGPIRGPIKNPLRLRLLLDAAFVLIAVGIFGQVYDPDILFHGIWVVLTLEAFLFGLRVTAIRIAAALLLLVLYFSLEFGLDRGHLLVLELAEWPLMIVIAILVAVMADRVAATSRYYADLYRRASDRLLTAQEDERKRLGRDLHDGVGQTLTAVVLTLDAAESALWAGERAPAALTRTGILRAQELAAIALEETRGVALQLRPGRFLETGLVAAVKWLAQTAGVPVTVEADPELDGPGLLEPDHEMNVYRVIQEALNNAVRYSHAQHIQVTLATVGTALAVTVADDGVGFDPNHAIDRGLGLAGMRERALVLRATLAIRSAPGTGSTVTMTVPLPGEDVPDRPSSGMSHALPAGSSR
jgi:signal transduction histidine kinase